MNKTRIGVIVVFSLIVIGLSYQNCSRNGGSSLTLGSSNPSSNTLPAGLLMSSDAGDSRSFPGNGQVFLDNVMPADGLSPNAYSLWLGLTGAVEAYDPVFNGTAGNMSSNEFFSFNGSQFFVMEGGSGDITRTWHHAGSQFTLEFWIKTPPAFKSVNALAGNTREGAATDQGVQFLILANGALQLSVLNGTATPALNVQTSSTISNGLVYQLAVVVQDGASGFFYANGNYAQVNGADTFNSNFASPSTGSPTGYMEVGDRGDDRVGVSSLPNGSQLYIARIYNRALSKADLDSSWNALRSRFGL